MIVQGYNTLYFQKTMYVILNQRVHSGLQVYHVVCMYHHHLLMHISLPGTGHKYQAESSQLYQECSTLNNNISFKIRPQDDLLGFCYVYINII